MLGGRRRGQRRGHLVIPTPLFVSFIALLATFAWVAARSPLFCTGSIRVWRWVYGVFSAVAPFTDCSSFSSVTVAEVFGGCFSLVWVSVGASILGFLGSLRRLVGLLALDGGVVAVT